MGFESNQPKPNYYGDRQIWLDSLGHLCFGVFPVAPDTILPADSVYLRLGPGGTREIQRILVSPTAYADGIWHQLVASLSPQGQFLYVDGSQVASNLKVTQAAVFSGTWRFGGGSLLDWVGTNKREYFQGDVDEGNIAHLARSPDWIRTSYYNLKFPKTFIRIEQPF